MQLSMQRMPHIGEGISLILNKSLFFMFGDERLADNFQGIEVAVCFEPGEENFGEPAGSDDFDDIERFEGDLGLGREEVGFEVDVFALEAASFRTRSGEVIIEGKVVIFALKDKGWAFW